MAYFCNGCGERRGGNQCKKWCVEKYGDMGATRIPRLDGMIFINDDGTGIPRDVQLMYDRRMCRSGGLPPKTVQGPRPQGWNEALDRMGERAATIVGSGLNVPEC